MTKKKTKTSKKFCKCGTPKDEVCLIPGTESCMACHELYVMEQTGVGVVHVDGLGKPFMF